MHLSPNLFSFITLLMPVIAVVGNNDSSVYFPTDDAYQGNSQEYNIQRSSQPLLPIAPNDLASLRGTNVYEKYVDDIISNSISKLTLKINKLLITQTKNNENVIFSPLSITSALALVLLGSNGATFKEISEFWGLQVGIPDIDKKSQIVHEQFSRMLAQLNRTTGFQIGNGVHVASAVFVQDGYPIRPIYKTTAEDLYHSSVLNVDFSSGPQEAQRQINNWVSQQTNNKIKKILNDVPSSNTRVILASALYFNAEWDHHFFAGSTRRRPFYVNGRDSPANIEVEMMSNGGEFPYYKDSRLGCEILGLPYKGNKSTMYIIMPFNSNAGKLNEFESKLTSEDLTDLVSRTRITGVVMLFPKMKIESTIDLRETLKLLGVKSLFDPSQANLAILSPGSAPSPVSQTRTGKNIKINDVGRVLSYQSIDNIRQLINEQSSDNNYQNPGLYADQVIHKVFMDITEKGTEAAAATSVSLSRDGSRVTFRVDVPFCFFIRHDETNTILFWGSVTEPTPSFRI